MNVFCFGVGWLGTRLVNKLNEDSFNVVGGTNRSGEHGFIKWEVGQPIPEVKVETTIVIAIPNSKWDEGTLLQFLEELSSKQINRLIWCSSVGAYGNSNEVQTEQDAFRLKQLTEKADYLQKQEKKVLQFFPDACVLRLGGLFGDDRHPALYLVNKAIPNPLAAANMIHATDATNLLFTLLKNNIKGVVNGVPPELPTRQQFYTTAFKKLALGLPQFGYQITMKHIASERINKEFDFKWSYRNPVMAYEV